jgi:GMP synthase-like glutamine amidotransferase
VGLNLLFVDCYEGEYGPDKAASYTGVLERAADGIGMALGIDTMADSELRGGEKYDLAVISGSHRMVGEGGFSEELAAFLRECRKPLLGICYGHQILARAWGATVRRDAFPHRGDEDVRLLELNPLWAGFPASFTMSESHHEVVVCDAGLEDHFRLLAVNGEGKVEAIVHRERPLYGVQFHPERSGAWGEKLLANFLRLAVRE